jgi:Sulfotransferase domain
MSDSVPKQIRPLWLASYPRSGNTFLRIIVERKFGLPTYSIYRVEGQTYHDPSADALEQAPFLPRDWRQRLTSSANAPLTVIKTHDLPEHDGRAIYLVRNGPAAIDSYYHYHKQFSFEQPSLTEVIAGACQFGSWSDHYFSWKPQTRADILFLKYEELVAQPEQMIPRISEFLGLAPGESRLPAFGELKAKVPAFFRRGADQDFLADWTPAQLALFRQLHAPAMQELGYSIPAADEPPASMVSELASSAARLHRLYVQQLHNQELSLQAREQLSQQVKNLVRQVDDLSNRLADEISQKERLQRDILEPLLQNRWVKLGMSVRAVPRPSPGNGRDPNSSSN